MSRQHCCLTACLISKRFESFNFWSRCLIGDFVTQIAWKIQVREKQIMATIVMMICKQSRENIDHDMILIIMELTFMWLEFLHEEQKGIFFGKICKINSWHMYYANTSQTHLCRQEHCKTNFIWFMTTFTLIVRCEGVIGGFHHKVLVMRWFDFLCC